MRIVKVALMIVIGILFLFGFYMGFTLLALKSGFYDYLIR